MKKILFLLLGLSILFTSCSVSKNQTEEEAVHITNEELEYEIIIFDIGFNNYLNTIAKPMSYHSQSYLESKNRHYVSVWNSRVANSYNMDLYENTIDYDYIINYGLEVNYKLYNYFKFVEYKYGETF